MQTVLNLVIKVFLAMWDTESAGINNDKENISQISKQKKKKKGTVFHIPLHQFPLKFNIICAIGEYFKSLY